MRTYEYRCRSCGEHLEVVQSFKDDPLTVCPQCEGELRKVFSPIGISFKGSGFYKTDSRSSSAGSKSASTNAESKAESKTEAKSSEPTTPSDTKSSSESSSKST